MTVNAAPPAPPPGPDPVPDLDRVAALAAAEGLEVFGAFHPGPGDGLAGEVGTLVLLGPREPGFWTSVTAAPEFADGGRDPLDRWSRRVISGLAGRLGGAAHFPFGGPPFAPFLAWAVASGRAWRSPVGLLVHETAGLLLSYRGALALGPRLALPPPPAAPPCAGCPGQPCRSACPAVALGPRGYDVPACRAFLASPAGADCMARGCAVRRACPRSAGHARVAAQAAWHMRRFLG